MKHKHYDKIVAKAANTDLVVFYQPPNRKDLWIESGERELPTLENYNYFLCLPQHKEACWAWLNGSDVGYTLHGTRMGIRMSNEPLPVWDVASPFMWDNVEFRVLPKKEKRWIVVDDGYVTLEKIIDYCKENDYLLEHIIKVAKQINN